MKKRSVEGEEGATFLSFPFLFSSITRAEPSTQSTFWAQTPEIPIAPSKTRRGKLQGFFVAQTEEPLEQIFLFNVYFDSRS